LFVKLGLAFPGVLTALTNKHRELSFLLAIDGSKSILDKIILADREKPPESMPFSLD
jgi:hypothetical protein